MPPKRDMAKPARVVAATPAVWRRPSLSEGLSAMQAAGGGANTLRREFPANVLTGTRLFLLVEVISHMGRTGLGPTFIDAQNQKSETLELVPPKFGFVVSGMLFP